MPQFYQRLLSFFVLFLAIARASLGQASNYTFTSYNQEQGLISSTISGIKKDNLGYLWLFSENGISRFDGYSFRNIKSENSNFKDQTIRIKSFTLSPSSNTILFITQNEIAKIAPGGNTYTTIARFTQSGSAAYFIQHQSHFIIHDTKANRINIYDPLGNFLHSIDVSKWPPSKIYRECVADNILILQDRNLVLIDINNSKVTSIPLPKAYANTISIKLVPHPFKKSTICLVLDQDLYDLNYAENFLSKSTIPSDWQKDFIDFKQSTLCKDGIYLFDGENLTKYSSQKNSRIPFRDFLAPNESINFIASNSDNKLWIITKNSGLYDLNPVNNSIKPVSTPNSPSGLSLAENIETIITDANVTWFSSPGNGLIKMEARTQTFKPYNPFQNNSQSLQIKNAFQLNVRTLCEIAPDNVLVGTLHGLLNFNTSSKAFTSITKSIPALELWKDIPTSFLLKDPEGDLWISAWNELRLSCYSSKHKTLINIFSAQNTNLIKGTIRCFFFDKQNNLWIGTPDNKIYKCDWRKLKNGICNQSSITEIKPEGKQIPDFGIIFNFIQATTNEIFILCENGLIEYNTSKNTFKTRRYIANGKRQEFNNVRSAIVATPTYIWLGTNGSGLFCYNIKSDSAQVFNTSNGLRDNFIYSIQKTDDNEIWLGTNNGLSCYNGNTHQFVNYASIDGLQSAEFNTNASLQLKSQELIFGGICGLNYFNPNSIEKPHLNNPLLITAVWNNGNELTNYSNKINLPFSDNNLRIEFAALGHFRNSEYQYAYQLKGLNDEWINCGNQREVMLLKIPSGKYKFRVKVRDCYGNWTQLKDDLIIKIETPWYRTWWFYLTSLILIITVTTYIIFEKLEQIKRLQEIRNNIAKDLHDEVGANLSNITLFLALIKQKLKQTNSAESDALRLFDKINLFAQQSQESMSDIVWMINSKNDQFLNLAIKMKDYANSISEDINTAIHFSIDSNLDKIKMDMLQRKNIYLFFKEAFTNSVKYSNCGEIKISAKLINNKIELSICDNGIGFNTNEVYPGNGLNNMKRRAEQVCGTVIIRSKISEGTCVTLLCPYKEHN